MYKKVNYIKSDIGSVEKVEGETIEQKIERIMDNKEPITDGAPEIYTERKDGVIAAYNIRTDRFEIACEAMSKVEKMTSAKREEKAKVKDEPTKMEVVKEVPKTGTEGEAQSIRGEKGVKAPITKGGTHVLLYIKRIQKYF